MAESEECKQVPEVDDTARMVFGALLSAASIAAAAYNTYRAVSIAMDEYELACRYWYLAEAWLNLYQDLYAPVEDVEIDEAMNIEKTSADYDPARGRARALAFLQFKGKLNPAIRATSRYCTGKREDIITQFSMAAHAAVALADGLGYRNERAYMETRNEIRFKKLLATAKRGRNMVANNVSFAASAAGIYGKLADQAWEGITGAGYGIGYLTNRHELSIPRTMLNTQNPSVNNYAPTVGQLVNAESAGYAAMYGG